MVQIPTDSLASGTMCTYTSYRKFIYTHIIISYSMVIQKGSVRNGLPFVSNFENTRTPVMLRLNMLSVRSYKLASSEIELST